MKRQINPALRAHRIRTLVLCGAACLIITGTLPAFFRSEAPANVSQRTLTFAQRVFYQRAIEEVYWRHRIWPKENPEPKPSLDGVISQAQIERKVEDYLRKSQRVADKRGRPITESELQAEMERMASHTLHPRVLLELFQALDNDPFVIAECLARPLVAERLGTELAAQGGVEAFVPNAKTLTAPTALTSHSYNLPRISVPLDCTADTWMATTTANAPEARTTRTAVWTGSEMIIWGGGNFNGALNTGGRYDPATDTWIATSIVNAPTGRGSQSTVWTGSEVIIWGGFYFDSELNTGGRYNPIADSWTATSTVNVPLGRTRYTRVWTGSEMIVWGGVDETFHDTNTGGRYNPSTDSWVATSINNAPPPRDSQTAVWTGSEMIVWGGVFCCPAIDFNTGGRYNASTDSWTATSTISAPLARWDHTAVWTGSQMVAWGGNNHVVGYLNTGGRYCAQSGSPTPTPTPTATPSATAMATASPSPTLTPTPTATPTATATPVSTSTPRPTPTPRVAPTPKPRPTPPPRP